ncbi:MAG: heavy metal translocating P-type ATPase [Mariniblastus sp.]|nr:heavy metal translocating P-type ATPase [Mariniblastus sp.]
MSNPPSQHQAGCHSPDHSGHSHGGIFGERTELIVAILCGAALLLGWLISIFYSGDNWISFALYLLAYLFGCVFFLREVIESTLRGRFEIEFLMLVAAIGAAALGKWAEGSLLLFLFSMGHALEHYAMGRARHAIKSLAKLAPDVATVLRQDEALVIPVEELRVGDTVIIKTNERVTADGFVIQGESVVNQAPITGESVPVDKRPVEDKVLAARNPSKLSAEHRVFAGTLNGSGSLQVQVTQLANESTLARVITLVNEAESQQSPTQHFTKRFEKYFVPAVILLVALLHFAFLFVDERFAESFYRAMAVLVAASPCALAIATPSAVLSGVARAAKGGVLVKGGGPLENLGRLGAMAFDKTGTLTQGQPQLTDILCEPDIPETELLANVIAVESHSDHPLAQAVVRDLQPKLCGLSIPAATELKNRVGQGIQAMVNGTCVSIGKLKLFEEMDANQPSVELVQQVRQLESQGRTTMIVRQGIRYLGVLGLMDTPRRNAKATISRLRKLGIDQMIMISGDNQPVADSVAMAVGIDDAWGELMPEDKVAAIQKLRAEREVAMVGDGVNDAPAMAAATVGIAMGAAGSDVALETADVALMADDLTRLPFAVGLSRKTGRIIRQNLWFSLGMVAVLVPATLFGLQLGFAVLFHEGSTLLVVGNALRLLAYRSE